MKKQDIPQDDKILDGKRIACYVQEEDGKYVIGSSTGWDAVNVANIQAWEYIFERIDQVVRDISDGKKSVLAFYMEKDQMDVSLLAKYVKLSRWRVRRHLKPSVFKNLKPDLLERYASVFRIPVDELIQPLKTNTSLELLKKEKKIKE
ncbi:MAG: hypothetical protein JXL81_08775 [Deltaproteobacteria bacterium]|nr:hypothetical protein [Deltaproteobacteria bacterium]